MSCEAKSTRHFKVFERRSEWTSEGCCRCGTISFFRVAHIITAGVVLYVLPSLLLGAASSSNPVDEVPDRSRTSPLSTGQGWKRIFRSFRTSSGLTKTQPKDRVTEPHSPEEVSQTSRSSVFRSTSLPRSGYPQRSRAGWDATVTEPSEDGVENLRSSCAANRAEKGHVKGGGVVRAASKLIRRPSTRAPSSEKKTSFEGGKSPRRAHSFFSRRSTAPLPSPAQRIVGKSESSGGERRSAASSAEEITPARASPTTAISPHQHHRRKAISLTDATSFDLPTHAECDTTACARTYKNSLSRLLHKRSHSGDSSHSLSFRGHTGEKAGRICAAREDDSAVESGGDTNSNASSLEDNARAAPSEQERKELPEPQTQKPGDAQSRPPQDAGPRPWYLTIRLDTGKYSFSKEDTAVDPSISHVKVVLLRASDGQTAPDQAHLPLKLRLPRWTYLCFTLDTLSLALEEADIDETTAILQAIQRRRRQTMSGITRLADTRHKSLDPHAVWCVVISNSEEVASTSVVLSDDEVEDT